MTVEGEKRVPLKDRAVRVKDTLFHPERQRQQVLGEIYTSALGRLKNDNPQFITAREGWGVNHLRVDYSTFDGHTVIIATSDVPDTGELSERPSEIALAGTAITPYPESSFWLSTTEQGRYSMELRAWDGSTVERFKFKADTGKKFKERVFDEVIPNATRWLRKPYGTQE